MSYFGGYEMDLMHIEGAFQRTYKCFSINMMFGNEREDLKFSDKIIMPPSALRALSRPNVQYEYPMLFKLQNIVHNHKTHAGVLEFSAEEGTCYLPQWMMRNLLLNEGGFVMITKVSLPVATYTKLQPESTDFLEITDQKAVLEYSLRIYSCLTEGDVFAITYNNKVYELRVLETKPEKAVSIYECDMDVEFEAPVGFQPMEQQASVQPSEDSEYPNYSYEEKMVAPFEGRGMRLDGKRKMDSVDTFEPVIKKALGRGVPDYDFVIGNLKFDRSFLFKNEFETKKGDDEADPERFPGRGYSMK